MKKIILKEDKQLIRKKKDNLVFFVERVCVLIIFLICVKTLNDSYFQTEGVSCKMSFGQIYLKKN